MTFAYVQTGSMPVRCGAIGDGDCLEDERLTGDAASSPLVVRGGMPDQFAVGFGAAQSFDIKTPW